MAPLHHSGESTGNSPGRGRGRPAYPMGEAAAGGSGGQGRSTFPTSGPGIRSGLVPPATGPVRATGGPEMRSAGGGGVPVGHRSPGPFGLQEVTEPFERPRPDLGHTALGDAEEPRDLDEGLALHERERRRLALAWREHGESVGQRRRDSFSSSSWAGSCEGSTTSPLLSPVSWPRWFRHPRSPSRDPTERDSMIRMLRRSVPMVIPIAGRELSDRRGTTQLIAEGGTGIVDGLGPITKATGSPIKSTQLVHHRAPDPVGRGQRLEFAPIVGSRTARPLRAVPTCRDFRDRTRRSGVEGRPGSHRRRCGPGAHSGASADFGDHALASFGTRPRAGHCWARRGGRTSSVRSLHKRSTERPTGRPTPAHAPSPRTSTGAPPRTWAHGATAIPPPWPEAWTG